MARPFAAALTAPRALVHRAHAASAVLVARPFAAALIAPRALVDRAQAASAALVVGPFAAATTAPSAFIDRAQVAATTSRVALAVATVSRRRWYRLAGLLRRDAGLLGSRRFGSCSLIPGALGGSGRRLGSTRLRRRPELEWTGLAYAAHANASVLVNTIAASCALANTQAARPSRCAVTAAAALAGHGLAALLHSAISVLLVAHIVVEVIGQRRIRIHEVCACRRSSSRCHGCSLASTCSVCHLSCGCHLRGRECDILRGGRARPRNLRGREHRCETQLCRQLFIAAQCRIKLRLCRRQRSLCRHKRSLRGRARSHLSSKRSLGGAVARRQRRQQRIVGLAAVHRGCSCSSRGGQRSTPPGPLRPRIARLGILNAQLPHKIRGVHARKAVTQRCRLRFRCCRLRFRCCCLRPRCCSLSLRCCRLRNRSCFRLRMALLLSVSLGALRSDLSGGSCGGLRSCSSQSRLQRLILLGQAPHQVALRQILAHHGARDDAARLARKLQRALRLARVCSSRIDAANQCCLAGCARLKRRLQQVR